MSGSLFKVRGDRPGCGYVGCPRGLDRYALPVFVGGRRLRLIPVIALASGLAACGGSSDSPRKLPPVSTTPAATQSPVSPQDPKAAATAVVREYFHLINAPTTLKTANALR